MLKGILNGLSISGLEYLNHISERLIVIKMIKTMKLAIFATIAISPMKTNIIEIDVNTNIETHGVLVLG